MPHIHRSTRQPRQRRGPLILRQMNAYSSSSQDSYEEGTDDTIEESSFSQSYDGESEKNQLESPLSWSTIQDRQHDNPSSANNESNVSGSAGKTAIPGEFLRELEYKPQAGTQPWGEAVGSDSWEDQQEEEDSPFLAGSENDSFLLDIEPNWDLPTGTGDSDDASNDVTDPGSFNLDDSAMHGDSTKQSSTPSPEEEDRKTIFQRRLKEQREKYRRSLNDTGSPEYQVASLTERINYLTVHMKENPHDYASLRGMVALVNKRRRHLNYLFREDNSRYKALISSLGIRHKMPGIANYDRKEKYKFFPKQKAVKVHLLKKRKKTSNQG